MHKNSTTQIHKSGYIKFHSIYLSFRFDEGQERLNDATLYAEVPALGPIPGNITKSPHSLVNDVLVGAG